MEDGYGQQSKYNEANLNILRLHHCWMNCRNYRRTANYNSWKWELDNIWSELCQDVDEDKLSDYKDVEEENAKLRKEVGKSITRDQIYEALNRREVFLRRLQERVGKGGVWLDGTEEDFD